jgi:hypothetical protein
MCARKNFDRSGEKGTTHLLSIPISVPLHIFIFTVKPHLLELAVYIQPVNVAGSMTKAPRVSTFPSFATASQVDVFFDSQFKLISTNEEKTLTLDFRIHINDELMKQLSAV